MFWRNRKHDETAVAGLTTRVRTLEACVLGLCDEIDLLKRPRVAAVVDENDPPADGYQRH
jgi:hypothetical protein